MKINHIFTFLFKSIIVGLALAFVILTLIPSLAQKNPSLLPTNLTQIQAASTTQHTIFSYADTVEITAPAVVNIFTQTVVTEQQHRMSNDPFLQHLFGDILGAPRERLETSLGSGVIVHQKGIVLTNNHVIKGADQIDIALRDGRITRAKLIGSDPESDVAVLRIELDNLPVIALGNSEQIRVGDVVLAIGNPFGVGQTVTSGIISGTGRNSLGINTFENFIQTDAAINPGNSGGALVNPFGQLIGINTAIFSRSGGSQGIGFAIPVNLASNIMHQILEHGFVVRGWLGVTIQDITPQLAKAIDLPVDHGVIISNVVRKGPADDANLLPKDIILKINGVEVDNQSASLIAISRVKPGEKISLTIIRNGKKIHKTAKVVQRPPHEN